VALTAPSENAGVPATTVGQPAGKIEQLKVIGGLVALGTGLFALLTVVIVALAVTPATTGGSIATAGVGVIGSIVGAYFGVKVGSDGTQAAISAQREEAVKAQVFAAHIQPQEADAALAQAASLIRAHRGLPGEPGGDPPPRG
jgi:hypothetical protein